MENWRDQSACKDVDPEIFFPLSENGVKAAKGSEEAKSYCRVCPVNVECFDSAIQHERVGARHGVWGGATPTERDIWEAHERNAIRRATRRKRA